MQWYWTWSGKCFGYMDNDNLWTYDGRHVGKLVNEEIFGPDGNYLGEIKSDNRLITNVTYKRSHRGPRFRPLCNRVGYVKFVDYVGYVMYVGFEDFPSPEML